MQQAGFHLVDHQRRLQRALQKRHLRRPEVAHTKEFHLASLLQLGKRAGHLGWVHQPVRPVQLININAVNAHALEGIFTAFNDVRGGLIVAVRFIFLRRLDAALGGDHRFLGEGFTLLESQSKQFLAHAVAINIGVIK